MKQIIKEIMTAARPLPDSLREYIAEKLWKTIDQPHIAELPEEWIEEIHEKCQLDLEELILKFGEKYLDTDDEYIFNRNMVVVIKSWNCGYAASPLTEDRINQTIDTIRQFAELKNITIPDKDLTKSQLVAMITDLFQNRITNYNIYDVLILDWEATITNELLDFAITVGDVILDDELDEELFGESDDELLDDELL
jgi:hypothetical protein